MEKTETKIPERTKTLEEVHAEMEKALSGKDVVPHHIPQPTAGVAIPTVDRMPPSVQNTTAQIEKYFQSTADAARATAAKLEDQAQVLREEADRLEDQKCLADDIRHWVSFERTLYDRVQSLQLVDVGIRKDS